MCLGQVNIKSLEDVVGKYLALAEKKTEAARAASHQAVVDVDDLDVIQSPERSVWFGLIHNSAFSAAKAI